VNVPVEGPSEEEEEGTTIASEVVKVEGKDPGFPGYLRGDRVRGYVGEIQSWVRPPWLALEETPGLYYDLMGILCTFWNYSGTISIIHLFDSFEFRKIPSYDAL